MLAQERLIGNYTNSDNPTKWQITHEERVHLALLIKSLSESKKYKEETHYLAISLADRYLECQTRSHETLPCLVSLGLVCLLIAAKIE